MACDICGKVGTMLVPLLDVYRTKDIHDICGDCEKVVNDKLLKIRAVTFNMNKSLLIRFMEALKIRKHSDCKKSEGKP